MIFPCALRNDITTAMLSNPTQPRPVDQKKSYPTCLISLSLSLFSSWRFEFNCPWLNVQISGPDLAAVIDDPCHGGPDNYIMLVLKLLIDDKTERYIALKIINFLLLFIVKDKFH